MEQLREVKPARPAPLKLYDEPYKACGKNLCLTPAEAQKALKNKAAVSQWMGEANNLLDYYESKEQAEQQYRLAFPEPFPLSKK